MTYGREYVICLNDNFKTKNSPNFGEVYEVEVDMTSLLQLKGYKELFPQENFEDITESYNELIDTLIDNGIIPF